MKLFAIFPILFAASGLCANIVIGSIDTFCYLDLSERCVVLHRNGYSDGFARLYISDPMTAVTPEIQALATKENIKIEPWTPFVDEMLALRHVQPETRVAEDDIISYEEAVDRNSNTKRDEGSDPPAQPPTDQQIEDAATDCGLAIAACAVSGPLATTVVGALAAGVACTSAAVMCDRLSRLFDHMDRLESPSG